jgi:hypothetical protein
MKRDEPAPVDGVTHQRYYQFGFLGMRKGVKRAPDIQALMSKQFKLGAGRLSMSSGNLRFVTVNRRESYVQSADVLKELSDRQGRIWYDLCLLSINNLDAKESGGEPLGALWAIGTPYSALTGALLEELVSGGIYRHSLFLHCDLHSVVEELHPSNKQAERQRGQYGSTVSMRGMQGLLPGEKNVSRLKMSGLNVLNSSIYRFLETEFGEGPLEPRGLRLLCATDTDSVVFHIGFSGGYRAYVRKFASNVNALISVITYLAKARAFRLSSDVPQWLGLEDETGE